MKFAGIELPKHWWFPFLGAVGLLGLGVYMTLMVVGGIWLTDADKARIPIDGGNPTLEQLDEAIRLNPDYPQAYTRRARIRLANNDIPGASADVDAALTYEPGNPALLQLRAEIRRIKATLSPSTLPAATAPATP